MSAPNDRPRSPYFLLHPAPAAALPVAGIALSVWALQLLLPRPGGFVLVMSGVYALVAVMKVVWRDDQDKTVVQALVAHTDPGPDLRERAATWARGALRPRASDRWGPLVLMTGLAVACVVVAITTPSWPVALPAPFLLLWCAALVVAYRMSADRGARWLDDPPAPVNPAG